MKMFLRSVGLSMMVFLPLLISCQTDVLVSDGETGLISVDIYNIPNQLYYTTDTNGFFVLPAEINSDIEFTISYTGYEPQVYTAAYLRTNALITLKNGLLLDEVVMVGRTDERTQDVINQIESVRSEDIQSTSPQTSADALAQHAGVFVQKSQMGGGSPVVRGFEANKVLLVVDGVRMNNAIYRGGHLQNAITVDASILERAEVIYGPGSLVYGSDALGGVVHFRSKNPKLSPTDKTIFSGESYLRYSSANNEKTGHFHVNVGNAKLASLTSVTISGFGDLRTGSVRNDLYPEFGTRPNYVTKINGIDSIVTNPNPNKQIGTAYRQYDILQKFSYRSSEKLKLIANIQHSTSSNVPRYDALTESSDNQLRYAEWYYGPQKRWLASARLDYNSNNRMFDKLIAIIAYQHIDEDRIDRRYRSSLRDIMNEDVNVISFTTDFKKQISENWDFNYGLEINYNSVNSIASSTNIDTGLEIPSGITRYPSDGSNTKNTAVYLYTKKTFNKLDLLAGLRYTYNNLNVKFSRSDVITWPEEFYNGLTSDNFSLNWSLGGLYDMGSGWRTKGQIATAFRSPNIDDLAKIRINDSEVAVPNLDLGPESSITVEATVSKHIGKSHISATVFQTSLDNAIIRENFALPDGTEFFIDEGDSLQIVANINAEKATVQGLSFNLLYQINQKWSIVGSSNIIKGTSIDANENKSPLAHIPPVYGKVALGYKQSKHHAQLVFRYNGEKPIDEYGGSSDNPENATIDGTPAWNTWNVYYTYHITKNMRVAVSFENILDKHFRTFSSGVSAASRNLSVTLGVQF